MTRKASSRIPAAGMFTAGLITLLPALVLGASQHAGDAVVHASHAVGVAQAHPVAAARADVTSWNPRSGPPWT